jgi:hypothetical protein
MSFIITIGPSLFQIFFNNVNYRAFQLSKDDTTNTSALIVIDVAYFITMLASLTFLIITSLTEPGIIPREEDPLSDII